ncbi:hypothetical protein [Streptomyces formicae]
MVTSPHEASHRIFQEQPELLRPVFRILGVPLPERPSVEVITPDVTETRPLERRIDTLLCINEPDGDGFLLAIEAQRRRDPDKAASWGYYLSYLHSKYRIPALLLVVCQDKTTSDWAKGPKHWSLPWGRPGTGRRSTTTGNWLTRAWEKSRPGLLGGT